MREGERETGGEKGMLRSCRPIFRVSGPLWHRASINLLKTGGGEERCKAWCRFCMHPAQEEGGGGGGGGGRFIQS